MKEKQTFIVDIYETQNRSWQGKLRWIQGQRALSFRSVLELLCLIDSVIGEDEKNKNAVIRESDAEE